MIIDSHNHFWHYSRHEYAWINENMHVLKKDFHTDELLQAAVPLQVVGTVAVQARQTLQETEYLLNLAEHEFVKGVVGWVDLQSREVADQLAAFTHHPKFKGVRHIVQDEPDDYFLLRDDFNRGIATLTALGLTYDLLIYSKHLPTAYEFARQHPHQPIVLDHLAKPPIKAQALEPWQADIAQLASLPNVYCKISGMVTEAHWQQHHFEHFVPYLDWAYAIFGPDRLMFGSDWPVCLLAADYATVLNYTVRWLADKPADVQHKILYANAVAFYGLK